MPPGENFYSQGETPTNAKTAGHSCGSSKEKEERKNEKLNLSTYIITRDF